MRVFPAPSHCITVTTFHRRRLPHFHAIGEPVFVTWRLHGSLPAGRVFPAATTSGEAFAAMDRLLDTAREGPMHLRAPEIAQLIVDALHYHARSLAHFDLHHYVVMPNHVHILITPRVPTPKLMHSLKRYTAREANRILRLSGQPFWQEESYDRIVRNGEEFRRIARYIEANPVRAGLASTPEGFLWSSARRIDNPPQVSNLPHNP
jgi:putative transposase